MTSDENFLKRSPQFLQQDLQAGSMKGFVVDRRDPHLQGGVRITAYGMDGDYKDEDVYTMKWASPIQAIRGAYAPPDLWDRVMLSFDGGEKDSPLCIGHWNAAPMGEGTLPLSKWKGSFIRPENWLHHDLYPETIMLGCSGPGNAIWYEDIELDKKYLASSINLVDTGGRYLRIKSLHMQFDPYSPVEEVPEGEGALYQADFGELKPTRKGTEFLDGMDSTLGALELGQRGAKRALLSGEKEFVADTVVLRDQDDKVVFQQEAINGKSWSIRQEMTNLSGFMDTLMLNASGGVMVNKFYCAPRRYDEQAQTSGDGGGQLA